MAATTNPVFGWDERLLAVLESTFNTTPNPASTQYVQVYDTDMGPLEQQDTRYIHDKTQGRGISAQVVSGQVKPMAWKTKTSVKTRAAVDAVPTEDAFYQAGGLVQTVNTGTSVAYSFSSLPSLKSLSIYRALGATPYEAQQGYGGCVEELGWSFGDHELTLDVGGKFAGKNFLGQASATVANGTNTSVTVDNAGDEYKLSPGWYAWESEIIQITAVQYGSGTFTCVRATLSSSGAAHTAKNLSPYLPVISQPTYTPISEANVTVTIDSVATRCIKGSLKLKTGISHLPHESGNKRVQGIKAVRYSITGDVELVLTDDTQRLEGKMSQTKLCAVTIVCGTGAGNIVTFSLPYCILKPFAVPSPSNDISIIKLALMPRDNAGNDMMTAVYT